MAISSTSGIPLDEADQTWKILTDQVEAFVAAWKAGAEPPGLADFLPDGPPTLRRLVLVELVKMDLEYRWAGGKSPQTLEHYLAAFPELGTGGVPGDLMYEEFVIRKQAGDAVSAHDYFARFPGQAAELGRLFELGGSQHSTTLVGGSQPHGTLLAGDQVDDFDLLTLLGKGAFASVYLARQRSLQRLVALKISADRGTEPQTLAQLDHPHIVRVHDQRLLPERGLRLLYMQPISGGTLLDVIGRVRRTPQPERTGRMLLQAVDEQLSRRSEAPPLESSLRRKLAAMSWPEVVCWLGARLAQALDYAHRRAILHRDVKPANVLLTAEGSPQLADFNISFSSKLEGASPAAFFGGSLPYMSPEQLEAFNPHHERKPDSLDGRSDLYSLGVTLWELLTGKRPFLDEHLQDGWSSTLDSMTARRHEGLSRDVVAKLPPGCPAGLKETLLRCLAPDRDQRYHSGRELARELELCLLPRAQELLRPPAHGWKQVVCRFPISALLLAMFLPNVLAALFNLLYNRQAIVDQLKDAYEVFWTVQTIINSIAFPGCLGLMALMALPVARGLRRIRAGLPVGADYLAGLRRRCLSLGHYAAGIGLCGWLLAAPAYPISMAAAAVPLPASSFLHFMASLTLCGLIAAGYPFFLTTFLAVRALYPPLVRPAPTTREDVLTLMRLGRLTGFYLLLVATVPMLAVSALVLVGSENRFALGVLSTAGLAGFGLAFWLSRVIQRDLAALASAVCPPGETLPDSGDSASA